jgi:transposase
MSIRAIAGPTPRRYQSGETDIWGGSADAAASWRAPRSHEVTLYEAAHSLLTRSQKRPALRAWGMKIANRRGMAKARMAVVRKLATILHRNWGSTRPDFVSAGNNSAPAIAAIAAVPACRGKPQSSNRPSGDGGRGDLVCEP